MRADRLLSMLLLLQNRGRMTAGQLAEELEVSERTIYRDVDALSVAGVPIYGERGRDGGYALLDSYRTTLTGLTTDEIRALFMLSIPGALGQLGLGQELRAALLKLSAALPAQRREQEQWVRQRIHLDWNWWFQGQEPLPHLPTLQQAVWEDRQVGVAYSVQHGPFSSHFERTVAPYGLVAKAGVWYLVGATGGRLRAFKVAELLQATLLPEPFIRPPDFDLALWWQRWCATQEQKRPHYPVTVRVAPALAPYLPQLFADALTHADNRARPVDGSGWLQLTLIFESLEVARSRLLACGGAVEVLAPLPLRLSLADFARQIVARYTVNQG